MLRLQPPISWRCDSRCGLFRRIVSAGHTLIRFRVSRFGGSEHIVDGFTGSSQLSCVTSYVRKFRCHCHSEPVAATTSATNNEYSLSSFVQFLIFHAFAVPAGSAHSERGSIFFSGAESRRCISNTVLLLPVSGAVGSEARSLFQLYPDGFT